jgi:hypothetical protein
MLKKGPTFLKIYVIPVLTLSIVLGGWDVIAANLVHSLWTYFGYVVIVAVSLYLYLAYLDRYLC